MSPRKNREATLAYQRTYYRQRIDADPTYRDRLRTKNEKSNKQIREAIRQLVRGFKSDGCALCDEKAECCLVAHHRDPSTKEITIGLATSRLIGPERVAAELAKCVCVCANCHAKIHAGLIICS